MALSAAPSVAPTASRVCPTCRAEYPPATRECATRRCARTGERLVDSRLGQILDDRYEVISILGRGSWSTVWMAVNQRTGDRCAVKLIERAVGGEQEAWKHELRATLRAASIHSAEVMDAGLSEDGRFYIVMELVDGQPLDAVFSSYQRQRTPLPYRSVVHIATQICQALAPAHRVGIIHQDLKPANVILTTRDGDEEFVKVLDFGVARLLNPGPGDTGASGTGHQPSIRATVSFGTPAYMAPEQVIAGGDVDERADLYSLGIMVYEALAGRLPFIADDPSELAQARLHREARALADLRPDLPRRLCTLVDTLLQREPDERPASADLVARALNDIAARPSTSILALKNGVPRPARRSGPLGWLFRKR